MYGYQPPEQEPEGSWREAWVILKIAVGLLAPVIAALVGTLTLVVLSIVLFFQFPPLALIPLSIIGAAIWWLVRRDRRIQEEERRRIHGDR